MKFSYLLLLPFIIVGCQSNVSENSTAPSNNAVASVNTNGEQLFKANCASCHKPNERYVGPALQGAKSRWESTELLYAFVKNSQDVISRNDYAKKLYDEYKQSPMLPYPTLSDKDIDDILQYCDTYK